MADHGIVAAPVTRAVIVAEVPAHFISGVLLAIGAARTGRDLRNLYGNLAIRAHRLVP